MRGLLAILLIALPLLAQAPQSQSSVPLQQAPASPSQSLPQSPTPQQQTPPQPKGPFYFSAQMAGFVGAGYTNFNGHSSAALQIGGSFGFQPLVFEGGYLASANDTRGSGFVAINGQFPLNARIDRQLNGTRNVLVPTFGYTQLFGRGSGIDYGIGVDHLVGKGWDTHAVRFEIRDYMRIEDRIEHNVGIRIGYVFQMAD